MATVKQLENQYADLLDRCKRFDNETREMLRKGDEERKQFIEDRKRARAELLKHKGDVVKMLEAAKAQAAGEVIADGVLEINSPGPVESTSTTAAVLPSNDGETIPANGETKDAPAETKGPVTETTEPVVETEVKEPTTPTEAPAITDAAPVEHVDDKRESKPQGKGKNRR